MTITNVFKLGLAILSSVVLLINPLIIVGSTQKELDELNQKLNSIEAEKADLERKLAAEQSQQSQVNNEISIVAYERDLIQAEINTLQLQLDKLNLEIEILTDNIAQNEKVIAQTENEIDKLKSEAQEQLSEMYLNQKTNNANINLIFTKSNSSFIRNGLYQQVIQEDTNSALQQLETKNAQLEKDKQQLEKDKIKIEEDTAKLEKDKKQLDNERANLQVKINEFVRLFNESQRSINATEDAYSQLTEEEQELQARLTLLKQQISNSVTEIGSGQFVTAGTIIGYEGNTGVTTGPHLHFGVRINGGYVNPCTVLPATQLANTTCGVSNPRLSRFPMTGTPWFTSGYRTASRPSHNAIDLSLGGGTPIIASHDGFIQYGNDGACSWYTGSFPCNGAGANYAIVCENKENCNSGIKTEYWHLQ